MNKIHGLIIGLAVVCGLVVASVSNKVEAQGVSNKVIAYLYDSSNQAIGILNGLYVRLSEPISGEDALNDVMKVEQRFVYTNIVLAAPTTTVVKNSPGFLHRVVINTAAATGVIICYDNTIAAGNQILSITQPAALLATSVPLEYNVSFSVGLTCVTSVAAQNITVATR